MNEAAVHRKSPIATAASRRQFLVAILLSLVCGHILAQADPLPSLVGRWQSFKLGGEAVDAVKSITFIFREDGTFSASATMADGTVQQHTGTYKLVGDVLEMATKGEPPEKGAYSLVGGILTINDPDTKSWVKFTRLKDPADDQALQ